MKKRIAMISALMLTLSLSVNVFATEITEKDGSPKEVPAEITTSIEPTYTVTIPEDVKVEFDAETTEFGTIELTAVQINPGYAVKVELDASGELKNGADKSKTIPYTIQDKATGEAFESAEYQNKGESTKLTIDITQEAWDAAYAGDYSDTVTFTISYGAETTAP